MIKNTNENYENHSVSAVTPGSEDFWVKHKKVSK